MRIEPFHSGMITEQGNAVDKDCLQRECSPEAKLAQERIQGAGPTGSVVFTKDGTLHFTPLDDEEVLKLING